MNYVDKTSVAILHFECNIVRAKHPAINNGMHGRGHAAHPAVI